MAPDRIEIRGLRALGVIGVNPEERTRAQPFEVDLDIEADLRAAGASDALDDTIDYGAIVARAEDVISNERHQLLERVAQRIADAVLEIERIDTVQVTLRKLRPPLPFAVDTAAVTITRQRS